jgi:hypothetical protein
MIPGPGKRIMALEGGSRWAYRDKRQQRKTNL